MPDRTLAYFSMEIMLAPEVPTYSGGLGALAGDTIRSAADLKLPMVAVSLLYRTGYFHQSIDDSGWQHEEPVEWSIDDHLEELPARATVPIAGRDVVLRAFRYAVRGVTGHEIPVYLLDSDLEENAAEDRKLTHSLYGGDPRYRLSQEVILGIGGVRMLRALGHDKLRRFHMNEGHAALLTFELADEAARAAGRDKIDPPEIEAVRKQCVFTTHTPVPAGHDKFPLSLMREVMGEREIKLDLEDVFCCDLANRVLGTEGKADPMEGDPRLNMTLLALNLSHYVNGVAKKHGEVSRLMFSEYSIDSITNGIHAATWAAPSFQRLFDERIPGWREDNFTLRYALSVPRAEVWNAHVEAKRELVRLANREANAGLDADVFTIGFARRAAAYKRADLLLSDLGWLQRVAAHAGPIQIIYAGKAHPSDQKGKKLIQRVVAALRELRPEIRGVYLANYDMTLGRLLTAGADLWLNTPQPPNEASGTSGMKAALNGVPSLSTMDGWWLEGCLEGITGWAIGGRKREGDEAQQRVSDAASLYTKLEGEIVPLFYGDRDRWLDVMRASIALNGSFFNTQRMVQEYATKAYLM